jgi:hypothetical protein
VSHLRERKDKICLNCNAIIEVKFCGVCGQENIEPKESVGHLINHFFQDITHFDGKFFSSVKYLITKPGFLSAEYVRGRRQAYLNPVRFYIFTSFIVFFLLFTFLSPDSKVISRGEIMNDSLSNKKVGDTAKREWLHIGLKRDTSSSTKDENLQQSDFSIFNVDISSIGTVKKFDSLNSNGLIPVNWLLRKLIRKCISLYERYGYNVKEFNTQLLISLRHALPQALFISLPFFAIILKLIYIRRKKFYYVSHIIFSIHLYIFIFLNILFIYMLSYIAERFAIGLLYDLTLLAGLLIPVYVYKALRNFYQQGRLKTFLKLFLISFLLLFLTVFFITFLFLFSISTL